MLTFACLPPPPPILLPDMGSPQDRAKVKKTITALESLAPKLAAAKPEIIIVSSPHPDWGINVPLHFLMPNSKFEIFNQSQNFNDKFLINSFKKFIKNYKLKIENSAVFPILTSLDSPRDHYQWGQKITSTIPEKLRVAWIASGDMSHRLKKDGPYGFHPSGHEFDQKFIKLLKKRGVEGILNLEELAEEAGECGLRSFCLLLGALSA